MAPAHEKGTVGGGNHPHQALWRRRSPAPDARANRWAQAGAPPSGAGGAPSPAGTWAGSPLSGGGASASSSGGTTGTSPVCSFHSATDMASPPSAGRQTSSPESSVTHSPSAHSSPL